MAFQKAARVNLVTFSASVETAAGSLRDLRVAEVTKMDMKVDNGKVTAFRTRVALSFKYEAE
jgi:flavin-binding protein dodecin